MKTKTRVGELTVADVMTRKVVTVKPDDSIRDAVALMQEQELTTLPVVGNEDQCIGVLSRSDLTDFFLSEDDELARVLDTDRLSMAWLFQTLETSDVRHVKELMTDNVQNVDQNASLADACKLFVRHRIHHLPVVDVDDRLIGLISTFDVVKALASKG
jgi:CBS-domain-containing membrane protein